MGVLHSLNEINLFFFLDRILSYTSDLPRWKVEDAIRRALMVWSDVTPLQFRKVDTGRADIEIRFARRGENTCPF